METERREPSEEEIEMVGLFCGDLMHAQNAGEDGQRAYAYGYLLASGKGFLRWIRTQYSVKGGNPDERE